MVILARFTRIEQFNHFGDVKYIGNGIAELRWKSGFRIYFTRINLESILVLNGGIKNAQKKDIKKAKLLIQKYAN